MRTIKPRNAQIGVLQGKWKRMYLNHKMKGEHDGHKKSGSKTGKGSSKKERR